MGGQTAVWTLKNLQFFSTNKNSKEHTRTLTLLHAEERGNQHEIRIAIFEAITILGNKKRGKIINKSQLGIISVTARPYRGCQRLVSRSHLSHITPLLCLLYIRRFRAARCWPSAVPDISQKRSTREPLVPRVARPVKCENHKF